MENPVFRTRQNPIYGELTMEDPERVEQLQKKVDQLVKVLEVAIDELRREGMHLTATSLNSHLDAILTVGISTLSTLPTPH